MNIKVTDLRVGNKVYGVRNGNLKEIVEVGKILWQEIITSIDDGARCFRVEDEVEGIPLSSDILEKCGFVKDRNGWHLPETKFSLTDKLYPCWLDRMIWPQDIPDFKHLSLNYVHELMNLFFSLTRQELTVNL